MEIPRYWRLREFLINQQYMGEVVQLMMEHPGWGWAQAVYVVKNFEQLEQSMQIPLTVNELTANSD